MGINQGTFVPRGHLEMSADILCCHNLGKEAAVVTASDG